MKEQKYAIARISGSTSKFYFKIDESNFRYAKQVVLEHNNEKYLGFINSFLTEKEPKGKSFEFSTFIDYSTKKDCELAAQNDKWLKTVKQKTLELAKQHAPSMNISHLLTDFDRKRITIYYTAPEHVDFRELLRELTFRYKAVIRLTQISAKQRFECFYHPYHIDYKSFKAIGYSI